MPILPPLLLLTAAPDPLLGPASHTPAYSTSAANSVAATHAAAGVLYLLILYINLQLMWGVTKITSLWRSYLKWQA